MCKLIAIGGTTDHLHIFTCDVVTCSISDLVGDIKRSSAKWINDNKMLHGHFAWQKGYGAFSYSASHVEKVVAYIKNQEEHHKKETFREEYIRMLESFGVEYDERFIFQPIE